MRVSWGFTRFVVLVGDYAVKIARPRPWQVLRRLIRHAIQGNVRARLTERYGSPFVGGLRYLFLGVLANTIENTLWREVGESWMVPTLWSCGIVNIQKRGRPISLHELDTEHPFRSELVLMPEEMREDLSSVKNFCRLDGRVLLCDYGSLALEAWLAPARSVKVKALAT